MRLSALDIGIAVDAVEAGFERLLRSRYSSLHSPAAPVCLRYRYQSDPVAPRLLGPDDASFLVRDRFDALDRIDAEIVIGLQRLRPELLFLHAAAVERDGRIALLAADSGVGKSTTTWALLHHGFSYASDELSAIDTASLRVFPYPRALSLKRAPPPPYVAPARARRVGASLHVPTEVLPSPPVQGARPLAAVFVLERPERASLASLHPVGTAEAAVRVYPVVLNALAHPGRGLASVIRLVRRVPCYRVSLGALEPTCRLIRDAFDGG